jgi:hypothetical protein
VGSWNGRLARERQTGWKAAAFVGEDRRSLDSMRVRKFESSMWLEEGPRKGVLKMQASLALPINSTHELRCFRIFSPVLTTLVRGNVWRRGGAAGKYVRCAPSISLCVCVCT